MVLEPGRSGSRDSCSLVGVSVLRMMMMCFFLRLHAAGEDAAGIGLSTVLHLHCSIIREYASVQVSNTATQAQQQAAAGAAGAKTAHSHCTWW
jgi:hypothetical protein